MNKFKDLLRNYNLENNKYTIKNNVFIVDDKYAIKKKIIDNSELYDYLASRNFEYYPKIININNRDDYEIYEYIKDTKTPNEQKALDIINLVSLLHTKTTFYKSVTSDTFKEIYEKIKIRVDDIKEYYDNIFININNSIYMSPGEYLLIRNISKVFASIEYCYQKLEEYLTITTDITKQRLVTLHNNLNLDHIIKSDKSYLISWNKSKIDMPIYDIYEFYQNHYNDLEFSVLLKLYMEKYPLFNEEKLLLFILLSIPKKIEFDDCEYDNVKKIDEALEYIFRSDKLIKYFNTKETTKS